MKRSIIVALVALLMATIAHAGPITKLSSSGWWDVWYGTSNRDGIPTCKMLAQLYWDNGTSGTIYVTWDEQHGASWQVRRSDWRMAQGWTVPMSVTFIDFHNNMSSLHTITAAAKVLDDPSLISFDISRDDLIPFLKRFGDAEQMTISFPQGDAHWGVKMDGSRNAAGSFKQCITKLTARWDDPNPTQPLLTRPPPALSDYDVADILLREDRARYHGPCPCPYNTARNGSRCGDRSAYRRPGGAAPLCYRRDVTLEMIEQYRQRQASR